MLKAALAGVLLATMGATFVSVQASAQEFASVETGHAARQPVVTEGHIARLRSALKLASSQQHLWPAVESALRNLARRQTRDSSSSGRVRRAAAAVGDVDGVRRVALAAGPLIASLDETQRQDGMRVIRSLGLGGLASAL